MIRFGAMRFHTPSQNRCTLWIYTDTGDLAITAVYYWFDPEVVFGRHSQQQHWRPLTKHFRAMASTREEDTPYNVNDRDTIKTICLIGTALCVCVCAFMCGSHTASSFWWTGKRNIGNTRLSGPCFARERINPIVKWRYLLNFSFVLFFVCFFVVWFISFCNLVQFHHSVL